MDGSVPRTACCAQHGPERPCCGFNSSHAAPCHAAPCCNAAPCSSLAKAQQPCNSHAALSAMPCHAVACPWPCRVMLCNAKTLHAMPCNSHSPPCNSPAISHAALHLCITPTSVSGCRKKALPKLLMPSAWVGSAALPRKCDSWLMLVGKSYRLLWEGGRAAMPSGRNACPRAWWHKTDAACTCHVH